MGKNYLIKLTFPRFAYYKPKSIMLTNKIYLFITIIFYIIYFLLFKEY